MNKRESNFKYMKKSGFFFLVIVLILGMQRSGAQTITFCKSVDNDGHAVNAAKEFVLAKTGSGIVFLFQFGVSKPSSVSYDLYKTEKGNEVFQSTIRQALTPGKTWASKEITLYDAGQYRVYVYDEKDKLLVKSEFTIKPAGN